MSEPNKYKSLNFLSFKLTKKDEDFSFSCKIFKSKRPTVDAFCTSIFNPFQFSLIKLFSLRCLFIVNVPSNKFNSNINQIS